MDDTKTVEWQKPKDRELNIIYPKKNEIGAKINYIQLTVIHVS